MKNLRSILKRSNLRMILRVQARLEFLIGSVGPKVYKFSDGVVLSFSIISSTFPHISSNLRLYHDLSIMSRFTSFVGIRPVIVGGVVAVTFLAAVSAYEVGTIFLSRDAKPSKSVSTLSSASR